MNNFSLGDYKPGMYFSWFLMLRSSQIEASVNDVSVSDDGSHVAHKRNILEFSLHKWKGKNNTAT